MTDSSNIDYPIKCDHPAVVQPGVYFEMSDECYHAAFALSAHGVHWLRVSAYDFWCRSRALNPQYIEENDSEAKMIGRAFDARIVEGREVFHQRYTPALDQKNYPEALNTRDELHEALSRHLIKLPQNTVKATLIERLLAVQPDACIWGTLQQEHLAAHPGKTFLPAGLMDKIEIAAAFIENDPELCKAFSGGAPQVSVFWFDRYGVPRKARFDYLKYRSVNDLKTTSRDYLPLKRAFARDIAAYRYHIQADFYLEAAAVARELIRLDKHIGSAAPHFLQAIADSDDDFTFTWICQRRGVAPMAKGFNPPPLNGAIMTDARYKIDEAAQKFARCWDVFGPDPWIEPEGIEEYDDTEIPLRLGD